MSRRNSVPRRVGALVLLMAAPVCWSLLEASRIRPVNLEEMSARADRIFSGRLVALRVERDAELGQTVTRATFQVHRAVKGSVGGRVTITILGDVEADAGRGAGVQGLPRFREGEEVVLFLYGDSARGLTSPVGFGQGKFAVTKDKRGRRMAVNGFGNRNLFNGLSGQARARLGEQSIAWKDRRGIHPDALLDLVKSLREPIEPRSDGPFSKK